jgi:hypothetical protein
MDERITKFIKIAQSRGEKKAEEFLLEVLLLHQTSKQLTNNDLVTLMMGVTTIAISRPNLMKDVSILIGIMLKREVEKEDE